MALALTCDTDGCEATQLIPVSEVIHNIMDRPVRGWGYDLGNIYCPDHWRAYCFPGGLPPDINPDYEAALAEWQKGKDDARR